MMTTLDTMQGLDLLDVEAMLPWSIWFATWYYRHRHGDPTAATDFAFALLAYTWGGGAQFMSAQIGLWVCAMLSVPILDFLLDLRNRSGKATRTKHRHSVNATSPWTSPLLIPARTTHTRFFPERHGFSYSYFMVGIPVGWTGGAGFWLSVDRERRALMEVNASDYLMRGLEEAGLRAKLDFYLISQNVDPNLYPYAFLVTAPRVLGYSFNPVSFWYLYSADRELKAMILEVNNTFDERRLYLLKREGAAGRGEDVSFSTTWEKDFHVSPFNDRMGSYSLLAKHLAFKDLEHGTWLSNTITLTSPEGKTKLVARIFSAKPPVDACDMSLLRATMLVYRFGWVGFVTFPRILKEAWKLYFRRKLDVWYRPEVARGSIGRTPTEEEKALESFFRQYLEHCVGRYRGALRLTYRPAQGLGLREEYSFESRGSRDCRQQQTRLEVLSPAFYSRLVHYVTTKEAITSEGLCAELKNRSIDVTYSETLIGLFDAEGSQASTSEGKMTQKLSLVDRLRWKVTSSLRCPPAGLAYGQESMTTRDGTEGDKLASGELGVAPGGTGTVWRSEGLSGLDAFVMGSCAEGWLYRRHTTRQFIAQRYAIGLTGAVKAGDLASRLGLAVICWSAIRHLGQTWPVGVESLALAVLLANWGNVIGLAKGL